MMLTLAFLRTRPYPDRRPAPALPTLKGASVFRTSVMTCLVIRLLLQPNLAPKRRRRTLEISLNNDREDRAQGVHRRERAA